MADFSRKPKINYLSGDFSSFVDDLIDYSNAHHSGVLTDKNESSPGMFLLESIAYCGDFLSFYQNNMFNELQKDKARQKKNVVSFARNLGYKVKGKRASRGNINLIIEVPATQNATGETIPDNTFAPILVKGSRFGGPSGVPFETLENISFSSSEERSVTGSRFDANTGLPTHFALMKTAEIISGETKTETFTIGEFEQFKTIEITEKDIIEIISVIDSDGNEWVEVDYLAQSTVFDEVTNSDDDSEDVPYVLRLLTVPRRFETSYDTETQKTSLIFGSGDGINFDDELIPNVADLALPLAGRTQQPSFAIDPQNFLKTRTLGLSPFNTTITVEYRVGGGSETNVPAFSIEDIFEAKFDFSSTGLNSLIVADVRNSLAVTNPQKTFDGGPEETISEIKANSSAYFAAQNRIVTREDAISRVLSLPKKFGKVSKAFVKRNNFNSSTLNIHALSRDENNHLVQVSNTLKNNLKTYLNKFRMLTDGINILETDIINLRMNFGITVSTKENRTVVLTKCLSSLKEYFSFETQQIGQPIVISDIVSVLQSIVGVVSVYDVVFSNVIGAVDSLEYSNVKFDVGDNTQNGIIYCPDDSVFEIKFLNKDIFGKAK